MRPTLRQACERKQLVRLWRGELEDGSYCGYVCAMGREYLAFWVLADNLSFDGIHLLRLADVTDVECPDRHHRFLEKAVTLNGLVPDAPPDLQLDDGHGVITSAASHSPVLNVRVDNDNPDEADVCYVGRLVSCDDDGFTMQEISPEADWLREVSFFGWSELASVCIADPYADTLIQVAGKPPALDDNGRGRLR